ncbi:nascent polypeptide-associated complex subunit alpha, muscle-specific form [Sorghum bicolor]|jgi:hypothetical protein|uniref:Uncharacterized protein n=1 Tax=Sorghum bicolor TaxID=4558 RepID=C5Z887_SORBI|nr:nascent polypeptide-associated complex subunit alpha, muscle-specific form [Sorghum bicolor]XP_021304740.1 nascent polypeptide-associated complex subunit alpha, muscle-specific form [Sorghum bicolor]EER88836.1 hypothetical protein SORBI_3010G234800 [Sorghum bicolor]OQU76916.1 hypothetical protein SORBI_3010G234800 [Sorghum bicolor]|eukprot:XP_002437469.1 nascent polypeptide-associated complex subunit alpha, muscle-specific form [Sorghum bicolor]
MEEDPLIPLVHVWNNAAFDHASSSAWHAHSPARASAGREVEGDKENHRPDPDPEPDVEAEIGHIEAEILRLSSRLHHLRTSKQSEPSKRGGVVAPAAKAAPRPRTRGLSMGPLDVAAAVNPNPLTTDKQQQQQPRAAQAPKPIKQAPAAASRGRGVSLGPLDIVAANPRVPSAVAATTTAPQRKIQGEGGAARPILRPIKEPPVQRRRGVSLGPLEIHNGVGSKPGAAARVKPFTNKLGAVREEGQRSKQHAVPARPWPSSNARQGTAASRAKARSGSMSPSRSRRQSTSKAAETRAGNAKATEAARGGNVAPVVSKVADELKPKGVVVVNHTSSNAATAKRPAGSSKVRVVPSRYSITPGSSLAAVSQDKRCKQSLPGPVSATSQREEIRPMLTEPSNGELSPGTVAKVAELLPRIKTMPPSDESPRDSGCAKRVADLVGKRSFFTSAADDGNLVTPYQARVVELESPEEEAAAEAEA